MSYSIRIVLDITSISLSWIHKKVRVALPDHLSHYSVEKWEQEIDYSGNGEQDTVTWK